MIKFLLLLIIFLVINSPQALGFGNDQEIDPKNDLILKPGGQIEAEANFDFQSNAIFNAIFDADLNTITNIENADIKIGANISRAKIQPIDANAVVINDGSGFLSSEVYLSKSRGGTGQDNSLVTFPAAGTLVTEGAAQTLINKTLTAPAVNGGVLDGQTASTLNAWIPPRDTRANLDILCPSLTAGSLVYATDEQIYYLCDGSALNKIAGDGGAGGINYILDPDAEDASSPSTWNTFQDTGFGEDNTGGSPTNTLVRNTTGELRGDADFLYTAGAATQYEGFAYDFSLDKADQSNIIRVAFDYQNDCANCTDTTWRVQLFDIDNANHIEPAVRDIVATSRGKYEAYIQTSSNSDSYRFAIINAGTLAASIQIDNVQVGPYVPVIKNPLIVMSAYGSALQSENTTAGVTVAFDSTSIDTFGAFDTVNNKFIAPETGTYFVSANLQVRLDDLANRRSYTRIVKNGSTAHFYSSTIDATPTTDAGVSISKMLYLIKGDEISIQFQSLDDPTWTISHAVNSSTFDVFKIGSQDLTGTGNVNYFRARVNASQNVVTSAIVNFDVALENDGNFDTVNKRYVAGESGWYYFWATMLISNLEAPTNGNFLLRKNGSSFTQTYTTELPGTTGAVTGFSGNITYLERGDYVDVFVQGDASFDIDQNAQRTIFGGFRINGAGGSASQSNKIRVRAKSNDGQIIVNSLWQEITYENEDYDTHNAFLNGTFFAPRAVHCTAYAQARLDGAQVWTLGSRILHRFNCPTCGRGIFRAHAAGTYDIGTIKHTDSFYLNKGETVFFEIEQSTGSNHFLAPSNDDNYINIECE